MVRETFDWIYLCGDQGFGERAYKTCWEWVHLVPCPILNVLLVETKSHLKNLYRQVVKDRLFGERPCYPTNEIVKVKMLMRVLYRETKKRVDGCKCYACETTRFYREEISGAESNTD